MSGYTPGPYDLRKGDSDAAKKWGGAVRAGAAASYVEDLQEALVDVGVLHDTPDGMFGAKTEAALKRFQWYLKKVPIRINPSGQAVPYTVTPPTISGIFGAETRQVLAGFMEGAFACGGNLVRVDFSSLPRFRANVGFKQLVAGASAMVVDRDFAAKLSIMNAKAQEQSLYVFVNQVFRIEGVAVNNPVVPPAGHSAHKMGRAVDLQLGTTATTPLSAVMMMNAPADSAMGRFRDHMKNQGCRYGGDWAQPDSPHYDQQIFPSNGDEWQNRFYFAQRQYSLSAPGSPLTRIPAA
jgi:hypothetical protein